MHYILTFPNTHNALLSEKVLNKDGKLAPMIPLPSAIGEGCGFCLRITEHPPTKILQLLEESGVQFETLYLEEQGASPYKKHYKPVNRKELPD